MEQSKKPLIITHGKKPVIKVSAYTEDPDRLLQSLRKSVLAYTDPFDPVGESEWEALQ